MKKNKLLLCVAFVSMSLISYSQTVGNVVQGATVKEKSLEEKMEGTYVIINKGTKVTQLLTTDVLLDIEKRREEDREVYYEYSPNITIKILSRKVISAPDFDPRKFY